MAFDPQVGDMVYYDFLWDHEHQKGYVHGLKDRACFVVVATKAKDDGSRRLILAGVSHRPPTPEDKAVNIPVKVGKYLGLDDQRSWIKTNNVNVVNCPKDRVPVGFLPVKDQQSEFIHGKLPRVMREELVGRVAEHSRHQTLSRVERENAPSLARSNLKPKPQEEPKQSKRVRPTLTLAKAPQERPRPIKSEPGLKHDKDREC